MSRERAALPMQMRRPRGCLDSSFWLVSADTAVISRVAAAFDDVTDARPPLSAWERE
jgi:hypothetical protein